MSVPKSERIKWLQAFSSLGIDAVECMTMNDKDFKEKRQFAQECGLEPTEDPELAKAMALSVGLDESIFKDEEPPETKQPTSYAPKTEKPDSKRDNSSSYHYAYPSKKPNIPSRTESGTIRDEQNKEYERLQREEAARLERERKEKEAASKRTKPAEPAKPSKPKGSVKDEYKRLAGKLPPESANGLRIGFTFHDGKRIVRKFDKNTKGEALKVFIQAEDNMFNPDGTPIGFSLQQTLGPQLDLNKTLEQQGIKKSAMFSVVLDD